jgi:hypothetical protein
MGRSSLDATKALLMRIARAEGRRLCLTLVLDLLFRVEPVCLLALVLAVAVELDLDAGALAEELDAAVVSGISGV